MRLKRIEAVRFGRLVDCTLGDLGDGLTVVTGPNEAGKSTFTHLVRYMLYGFPTAGSKQQPPFLSPAGDREGRLVFADGDGEWILTRMHGVKGGPHTVKALGGSRDRENLVTELTAGVSEAEYRVVFGFGLDELAEIERGRGTDNDIIGRLYAAGAGLTISPQEVGAKVEQQAADLFAPRAQKPEINMTLGQIRKIREEIKELESEAQSFADSAARLQEIARKVELARETRDEIALEARNREHELDKAETLSAEVAALTDEIETLGIELAKVREKRDSTRPDETVLEAEPAIAPLLEDVSAFRERKERVAILLAEISKREVAVGAALSRLGVDAATADQADLGPETLAGLESRKRKITGLESQREQWRKESERREDALGHLGDPGDSERIGAANGGRLWAYATAIFGAVGIVLVALAAVLGSRGLTFAAIVPLGVAAMAFFVWLLGRGTRGSEDTGSARSLEERDLAAARDELSRAESEYEHTMAEWRGWIAARSLDSSGEDPEAVSILVAELRSVQGEREKLDQERALVSAEHSSLTAFTDRVAAVARTVLPDSGEITVDRALEITARLGEMRSIARSQQNELELAEIEFKGVSERVEASTAKRRAAQDRLDGLFRESGATGLPELKAASDCAQADARAAAQTFDAEKTEFDRLSASLDDEGRAGRMAEARMELASLRERLNTLTGDFAVFAMATRLLEMARGKYERERQPEVVREAESIFAKITDGRYGRLTVPLSEGNIEVFDSASRSTETSILSRGTAEQLYLSLRIALINQMGDVGCSLPIIMDDIFVNFDEERRRGAVEAVVDLARTRQVIVFSCRPDTAELFASQASDLTELALGRC